jgi:GGDEF domain-containing protein
MGGDAFWVVVPVPWKGKENNERLFERLSSALCGCKIMTTAGEVSVTMSVGVAQADAKCCEGHLLDTVDAMMVRAKREGGNHVVTPR